jgi:hypothetical protein
MTKKGFEMLSFRSKSCRDRPRFHSFTLLDPTISYAVQCTVCSTVRKSLQRTTATGWKRQHLTCVRLNILSLHFTFLKAEFVVCRLAARRRSSRGRGLAASGDRGRFCFAPFSRRRAEDILQGLKLLL